jgi:hypothetical protein
MIFAPAMGIACSRVLAALCFFVTVLAALAGGKLWLQPTDGGNPGQLFLLSVVFAIGGVALLWFARLIERLARGE